jgi:NAD-dependent deacetylase
MSDERFDLDEVASWLRAAHGIVILTGAGISTESGIPDFRGPQGVWTKNPDAEKAATLRHYVSDPEVRIRSWQLRLTSGMWDAEPNAGHRALAKLVEQGKLSAIITQNIDGLHQRSGVPDSRIIELHGNTTYATCLDCGQRYELAPIRKAFEGKGELPVCTKCDGIVKTATISFGQAMPEIPMLRAQEEAVNCDLFIVLGSSLVVYPAASFPQLARRKGAKLAILNRDPTDQDDKADLVIHGEIGPTLSRVVGVN